MSLELFADLSLGFVFMVSESACAVGGPYNIPEVDDFVLACMGCYMP